MYLIATRTAVENNPAFLGRILNTNWLHEPLAHRCPVTRDDINVLAVQTEWTMIAIAPRGEWLHAFAAVLADEGVITARKEVFPHTLFCNRVRFLFLPAGFS